MKKTGKFVTASLFAALIFIATMFFNIKLPNGYANLGDCFIITVACLLGAKYGACSAAIGSTLADITLGYVVYAPATFIVKALMAVMCSYVFNHTKGKLRVIAAGLTAEVIMVVGYFGYESLLYGVNGAVLSVFGNTLQGIINIAAALILTTLLNRYISPLTSTENKK